MPDPDRTNLDATTAGVDIWNFVLGKVRERLRLIGMDAAEIGWFWHAKYNFKIKMALAGPYQRPIEAFTNCSSREELRCRIQLWTKAKESSEIAPRTTQALQDIKRTFHHDPEFIDDLNDTVDRTQYPLNFSDVLVEIPDPLPKEDDDEDFDDTLTNRMILDVVVIIEEALRGTASVTT